MSDTVVIDGDVSLDIPVDGEAESVIKVGHEVVTHGLSVTENGTYTAPVGVDGYTPVVVEVPEPTSQSKTVTPTTSQQVIEPDDGYDYLSSVTVNAYQLPVNLFPHLNTMAQMFRNSVLPNTVEIDFENKYPSSMQEAFYGATIEDKLIIKNLGHPEDAGISFSGTFRSANIPELELVNCNLVPSNVANMFRDKSVTSVTGGKIDMSYCTGSPLESATYVQNVEFVSDSIHSDFSMYMARNLSVATLVSVSNGLDPNVSGCKVDIRYSNLESKFQTLGNNVNGTFIPDENGSVTLEDFITSVKGWTIRNA